jgi:Ca-activated chloride channel family protein
MDAQMEFAWPWVFAGLLLPLLAYFFLPRAQDTAHSALLFPFSPLLDKLQARSSVLPKQSYRFLGILAWTLLVMAAARPQWIGESIQLPVSGRSLMLAVDISGSMEQQDMVVNRRAVSRLTAVKAVANDFIQKREGDYIGLILFGRRAYLQSPLSYDRQTVSILLDEAVVGLAGKETAIGDAIGLAVKRLKKQPEENRVLILLTDGANTAGSIDPLKAADLAAREKIKIYTIGVGDDSVKMGGFFGLQVINSDLDEETLMAIASKTGGRFFRARDVGELIKIYSLLDEIEPLSDEQQSFRPVSELYQWPLALSLLLASISYIVKRQTSDV